MVKESVLVLKVSLKNVKLERVSIKISMKVDNFLNK